ncbi:MAG: Clp protease ClpP [Synergistaceae bacterium]|nr:Clp protease ClpP [Synergistaceae bacterium]MBQ9629251.1 Clp protease ClpP [Synergistaceae bacterium]MBR0251154.1 Clp protease ClpP [Synergistaceae bacterium]
MWKVTAKAANEAEILLYDQIADFDISEWGFISAKGLINQIKALGKVENITLRINSVGGDVWQAQSMYSYLRSHAAKITVRVDGIAASAASLVAMAGDKIIMPSNSLMMIHNPSGGVYGEAEDLRDTAEILDKIRDTLANVYVSRTGLEREKIISMMDSETWMTADEAHDLKFCDEVEEAVEVAAMAVKGGMIFRNGFGFARVDENLSAKLPENIVMRAFKKEDKNEMEIKPSVFVIETTADLEHQYPDLAAEIKNTANEAGYNRGVQAERERLKALDSLNASGCEEIIARAKYEDPKDARDIAVEILQKMNAQAQLNALHIDAKAVDPVLPPEKDMPEDKAGRDAAITAVANELNRLRGYK